MMKMLDADQAGQFDFVYIDGAHSWAIDGLAVILAERLLRPGGWLLLDDLNWSFDDPAMAALDWVQQMPAEERTTRQVRKVWELLVKPHPSFDQMFEHGDWGFAHKSDSVTGKAVVYRYHPFWQSMYEIAHLGRRAYYTWRNRKTRVL
jgi:SAM-dependent methyltransferase